MVVPSAFCCGLFFSTGGAFGSFFGLGAGLNFGPQWSINLDWQRFKDVGDEDDTGEADIDRLSLGVIFRL